MWRREGSLDRIFQARIEKVHWLLDTLLSRQRSSGISTGRMEVFLTCAAFAGKY